MDQYMLAKTCRTIVGRYGHRLPAYTDIRSAYMYGLFADYHTYNPSVSIKSCYKYANGSTPYPHFLARHYGGANGYRRTLGDMMGIIDACPSITLLWQIQRELYSWVTRYLPPEEVESVCRNYVDQNATRQEMAKFLADIMHHAICRENVANRPMKSGELV